MAIRAIQDHVLVSDMNFGERKSAGGIVIKGDDATSDGIRPRWAKVVAVGHQQKDYKVGQYILIKHGRWTRGIDIEGNTVRRVDTDDVLAVSDVEQLDESFAGAEVVTDAGQKNIEDIYNY